MQINKSRRRLLMGMAAAGVAGVGGAYFLNRNSLARLALARRDPMAAATAKIVFVVLADGLGTNAFGATPPSEGIDPAAKVINAGSQQLWHPWYESEGVDTYKMSTLDTQDFVLANVSNELAEFRNRSLYLRGVRLPTNYTGHLGYKNVLRDNKTSLASIDHIIANRLPDYSAVQKAMYAGHISHNQQFRISYAAGGDAGLRDMENNPNQLFRTLFPGVGLKAAAGAHIFDPALADIKALREGLSGLERAKLDDHLGAVEQVAQDLADGGGGPISGCSAEAPAIEDAWVGNNERRTEVLAGHSKVLAAALACGVSRIGTFQIGATSEENSLYMEPDDSGERLVIANAHQSAHQTVGASPEEQVKMWQESRRWYVRRLKAFLNELARYQDPDVPEDNLLDHTLVVVTSELADGLPEHQWDIPLMMIGGKKSLGLNAGSGQGRLLNIRSQAENEPVDQYQAYRYQVNLSRIWHTVAAAAGVASGYDAPGAAGDYPVSVVSGIFSGIG